MNKGIRTHNIGIDSEQIMSAFFSCFCKDAFTLSVVLEYTFKLFKKDYDYMFFFIAFSKY